MVDFIQEIPDGAAALATHIQSVRQAQLPAMAKAERKRFEERGITFHGHAIRTDADGQAKIAATMMAFDAGLLEQVDFMTADGTFLSLDQTDFAALYAAMVGHVQDSFSRLAQVVVAIDAGTATAEAVRAAFT